MTRGGRPSILIVGLNWLGDCVMSLPAIALLRRRMPDAHLTLLTKPGLTPLWTLFPAIDEVLVLSAGCAGLWGAARAVRSRACDRAYVLPNSVRSALVPYLARIPVRRGLQGHVRRWLLTDVVRPIPGPGFEHQKCEYEEVVGLESDRDLWRLPLLVAPDSARERARVLLAESDEGGAAGGRTIGMFPGAARGPAKRWPAERFAAVARRLAAEEGCRVLLFGGAADAESCTAVAQDAGPGLVNLSGRSTIPDLAALVSLCRCVVSNDSGGMHLAAACGVPVVAIFGLTDPARTGPLGTGHRIVAAEAFHRWRDVPRDSAGARRALASISVDRVYAAARELLAGAAPVQSGEARP